MKVYSDAVLLPSDCWSMPFFCLQCRGLGLEFTPRLQVFSAWLETGNYMGCKHMPAMTMGHIPFFYYCPALTL